MTREEAANILEKQFDESCGNYRYQNKDKLDYEDALWLAIAALRELDAQENQKPLTLEELRQHSRQSGTAGDKVMEWISVKDELPCKDKEVLVVTEQNARLYQAARERVYGRDA